MGTKEFFLVIFKEWTMLPQESADFRLPNKFLIAMCIYLCRECGNKKYVILHEPSMQMIVLKNSTSSIK